MQSINVQGSKVFTKKFLVIGIVLLAVTLAVVVSIVLTQRKHLAKAEEGNVQSASTVASENPVSAPESVSTSSPTSITTQTHTAAPLSNQPATTSPVVNVPTGDAGPSLNPANTYNPVVQKGFVIGTVTTQVGGQGCGLPMGYCTVAYMTTITAKDMNGNIVASMSTAQDGSYGFKLKPGTYMLFVADVDGSHITPLPKTVTVTEGDTQTVDFFYEPLAMTN